MKKLPLSRPPSVLINTIVPQILSDHHIGSYLSAFSPHSERVIPPVTYALLSISQSNFLL